MDAQGVELFQRAQAGFTDRVDAVEREQWDAVALPGWDVADLVAHLIGEQLWVPVLLAGEAVGDQVPTDTELLVAGDPLGSWEAAADAALTAWVRPDAVRTVLLSAGPTPAADYLAELTVDLTVHTWDLARAVGADPRPDDALVEAGLTYAARRLGPDGIPGLVAPPLEVGPDADPLTRLLAAFGRRA
ncbi:TIGR03086 family protein [Klenkia soli]|uniref:TIGR03086 family protein n=1 Tax=Klenkia soli TaxID=1052260 RepID=A0A1H0HDE9_9ACTN|nr:TIGR03086 family metal-binding protein [Klenkia soli]SDO17168.1 TIGR03086 family protein [Klenkia soli]